MQKTIPLISVNAAVADDLVWWSCSPILDLPPGLTKFDRAQWHMLVEHFQGPVQLRCFSQVRVWAVKLPRHS
jgi:hypothetical protein